MSVPIAVQMLARQTYGVTESNLRAVRVEDPRATIQALADAGHSLRYCDDEAGERTWWFATTAPTGAAVVEPSDWRQAA